VEGVPIRLDAAFVGAGIEALRSVFDAYRRELAER
jgi:hypothetical protein